MRALMKEDHQKYPHKQMIAIALTQARKAGAKIKRKRK